MKIGFFDSGLGGLIILKAVIELMPDFDYVFYGDTANLPYGDKTEKEIFELTKMGIEFLFDRNCSLVIIACNTSSAETLRKIQNDFIPKTYPDRKVLGVIIPTVETVIDSNPKQITILNTKRTAESKKYEFELSKFKPQVPITSIATPTLVPFIEGGRIDEAIKTISELIAKRKITGVVVLGCTHYSVLKNKLAEVCKGKGLQFFAQDEIIPEKLKSYLENHLEIKNELGLNKTRNIFLTKHTNQYDDLIEELLNGKFT